MAGKRERSNGTWEFIFKRKGILDKPRSLTFDSEVDGDAYARRAEEMLDRGILPLELKDEPVSFLGTLLDLYGETPVSKADKELIPALRKAVGKTKLPAVTYEWVERWVDSMKADGVATNTLTKKVGLLARCLDWAMRKNMLVLGNNPARMLPRGYASAGRDKSTDWSGERDRRLEGVEEGAIRSELPDKNHALMFDMALETAMRMSEMITLKKAQIDLGKRTIFLEKTKNGSKRQVPMSSVMIKLLTEHLPTVEGEYLFPWWDGERDMRQLGSIVSHRWAKIFERAGCPDLHFHDLRHEATARFYERTQLSDLQISKITGHKTLGMLRRYANLRGSDLADKLW